MIEIFGSRGRLLSGEEGLRLFPIITILINSLLPTAFALAARMRANYDA
jgi:hypothetical protein